MVRTKMDMMRRKERITDAVNTSSGPSPATDEPSATAEPAEAAAATSPPTAATPPERRPAAPQTEQIGQKREHPPSLPKKKPKKAHSGYVLFAIANRDRVNKENPGTPFHEVTRILGHSWSALEPEEKNPYLKQAESDKAAYLVDLENWQSENLDDGDDDSQKKGKRPRTIKDEPAAVARPGGNVTSRSGAGAGGKAKEFKEGSLDEKSNSEHYCAPCRQYFQTHQAKREHLLGAKHKQTMANSTHQSSAQDIALTIPIFTKDFMDHYKSREKKLKELRRNTDECASSNSALLEQVDKMKRTLGQVDSSASAVREENDEYVAKLKVLRDGLFGALQGLAIPGASIKPESGEAIDGFVIAVRDAMQSASADPGFRAEVETRLKGIGVAPPQPAATAVP